MKGNSKRVGREQLQLPIKTSNRKLSKCTFSGNVKVIESSLDTTRTKEFWLKLWGALPAEANFITPNPWNTGALWDTEWRCTGNESLLLGRTGSHLVMIEDIIISKLYERGKVCFCFNWVQKKENVFCLNGRDKVWLTLH